VSSYLGSEDLRLQIIEVATLTIYHQMVEYWSSLLLAVSVAGKHKGFLFFSFSLSFDFDFSFLLGFHCPSHWVHIWHFFF